MTNSMRRWFVAVALLLTLGTVGLALATFDLTDVSDLAPPVTTGPEPSATASEPTAYVQPPAPTASSVTSQTPTPTIALTSTRQASPAPTPTFTQQPSPTLPPTPTPRPTLTAQPSSTLTLNEQPTPSSEPSPTLAVTHAPDSTAGPTATAPGMPIESVTSTHVPFPVEGRYIVINQQEQMMHVYEEGIEIRTIPCSTGLPDPNKYTPAWSGVVGKYWGTFFAYGVYADEAWYLFKSQGSILIHSSPYTIVEGEKAYQDVDLLGKRPASHGCIRIHPDDALWFTKWLPEGVPVVITPPDLTSP